MEIKSEWVDLPELFRKLNDLPYELERCRHAVVAADADLRTTQDSLELSKARALDDNAEAFAQCRNERERKQFETLLYAENATVAAAAEATETAQAALEQAKAALYNEQDMFSAVRNTIRLITALSHDAADDWG